MTSTNISDLPVELVPFARDITVDPAAVPSTIGKLSAAVVAYASLTATLNAASGIRGRTMLPNPEWVLRVSGDGAQITREKDVSVGSPFMGLNLVRSDDLLTYSAIWELRLRAPKAPIVVATAPAEEAAAVARLVDAARDVDQLMTLAALTNPDALASITSRQRAIDAAATGQIPAMTAAKVRQILLDAGLGRPDNPGLRRRGGNSGARVRPVNVRQSAKPVTLAIRVDIGGILSRPLTAAEEARSGREHFELVRDLCREHEDEWVPRAKAALEAAGWRVVFEEADVQRKTWYERHNRGFYVTRADEAALNEFAALAREARGKFNGAPIGPAI